jgi:hypothetical protein
MGNRVLCGGSLAIVNALKGQVMSMSPFFYVIGTIVAVFFILLGWDGEGIIHKVWLIMGGLYFGHILTEALNYVEGE